MSAAENRRYPERDLAGSDQPFGPQEPDLGLMMSGGIPLELKRAPRDAELAARGNARS